MKKIFTTIFIAIFSAISFSASSQKLTAAEFPIIGDSILYDQGDTGVALPTSGSAAVWNYSAMTKGSGKSISVFTTPVGGSAITGDNIVETQKGGVANPIIHYYRNNNELSVVGVETKILTFAITIPYSDKAVLCKFPVQLGTTNSDLFSGNFTIIGNTIYHYGGVFSEGLGTGTLTLPGGSTFNNAVLLHIIQDYTDSANGLIIKVHNRTVMHDYMWFVPGIRGWVCRITSNTNIPDTGFTTTTKNMWFMHQWGVGISKNNIEENSVSVFPNPANDVLNIVIQNNFSPLLISLTDATGREIKNMNFSANEISSQIIPLYISSLDAGIYFVKINEKIFRFVKE